MKKYYLHNVINSIGPYDIEELREKRITEETLVWSEGMNDWKKASEVDELKIVLLTIPRSLCNRKPIQIIKPKDNEWLKYTLLTLWFIVIITLISTAIALKR